MNCVTTPIVPSVAMNAKASGMPAKFAATPENVVRPRADEPRRALADRGVGDQQPEQAPRPAVTRLTSMLFLNAVR